MELEAGSRARRLLQCSEPIKIAPAARGDRMDVGGIILCGGQSSRMGRPKAWLPFDGEPMLVRVVRLISEGVGPLMVVAARGKEVPPLPADVEVVRDEVAG